MTRMTNGHDVGKEKRGAGARGANGHPCEVVSYKRLATPAVASNNHLIILHFIFSNPPSINRLALTRYTSPFSKLSSLCPPHSTPILFSDRAFFARGPFLLAPLAASVAASLPIPLLYFSSSRSPTMDRLYVPLTSAPRLYRSPPRWYCSVQVVSEFDEIIVCSRGRCAACLPLLI